MNHQTTRTFEFERKTDVYVSNEACICSAAVKGLFKTKASRIRIVGSFSKPKGKGWRKATMDKSTESITVSGRKFEMTWSLESFLDGLGVTDKPFYVKLEK